MTGELNGIKVLITRQKALSTSLSKKIAVLGGSSVCLPLFAVKSLLNASYIQSIQSKLNSCSLAICVSYNAANLLLSSCVCKHVQWATVGFNTASYLIGCGIDRVICPTIPPYNTANLIAEFKLRGLKLKNQYIIIVTGEGGDVALQQQLSACGANVEVLPIYRRVLPQISGQELQEVFSAKGAIDIVLITCVTSLVNLIFLSRAADIDIKSKALLVVSERIYAYAVTQGFVKVYLARSMTEADILSALIHLRQRDAKRS